MTENRPPYAGDSEERRIRELLGTLKEDVRAPAELREAVMREIEADSRSLVGRFAEWALRPRLVPVSPALAGLAAAALAALILVWPPTTESSPETAAAPSPAPTRFVLVAPGAASVHLTGDFIGWRPDGIALEDLRGTGVWIGQVELPPGVHEYTFVIDGSEWVADPRAVLQVDDGFGQLNSIVVVPEEGSA